MAGSNAIVIPWKTTTTDEWRKRHFDFLRMYYGTIADIFIGINDDDPFNTSAARNTGVKKADGYDVVAVIDADTYIPADQLNTAFITAAGRSNALVKPFSVYGYLTEAATESFYDKQFTPDYISRPTEDFQGGAYVMQRDTYWNIGGFDEDFIGWGGENDAFHITCACKRLHTLWVPGMGFHFYHPAKRQLTDHNWKVLQERYW